MKTMKATETIILLRRLTQQLDIVIERLPVPKQAKIEPVMIEPVMPIIEAASAEWGLAPALVLGGRRFKPLVEARTAAIGIIRSEHPELTLALISSMFGLRHHTAISHTLGNYRAWRENCPQFRAKSEAVLKRIRVKLAA